MLSNHVHILRIGVLGTANVKVAMYFPSYLVREIVYIFVYMNLNQCTVSTPLTQSTAQELYINWIYRCTVQWHLICCVYISKLVLVIKSGGYCTWKGFHGDLHLIGDWDPQFELHLNIFYPHHHVLNDWNFLTLQNDLPVVSINTRRKTITVCLMQPQWCWADLL